MNSGNQGKFKLKRSPQKFYIKQKVIKKAKPTEENQMNFTGDMKRLGMMAEVNDVKDTQIKIKIKCRHISPPPYMNGGDES